MVSQTPRSSQSRTAAFFRAAGDLFIEPAQVQLAHQRPDRSRRMIFRHQPVDIHRPPTHLLPVYKTDQRLLARPIFCAHAPSIPGLIPFSRTD